MSKIAIGNPGHTLHCGTALLGRVELKLKLSPHVWLSLVVAGMPLLVDRATTVQRHVSQCGLTTSISEACEQLAT